ncbi:hypothetical protein J3A84_07925 [Proteiniclasticum sp. SCR006]|uniref:Lipoprotein n=1 Tax=Proteiniclasticum aestuarii TaxID=2817862 RepID=A0A939H683_9CLOT|nr:hypothetical protein [Proteiniclasticum aestuarii]MBO1264954.1 hypothetical protein [Proteiniclasticum aestuarii]
MKTVKLVLLTAAAMMLMAGCFAMESERSEEVDNGNQEPIIVKSSSDETISGLEEKILEMNEEIEVLEELNRQYAAFLESSMEYMNEEDLKSLARLKHRYTLMINGEVLEGAQAVTVPEGPVEVKIVSEMLLDINLPQKLESAGTLTGSVDEHISFREVDPEEMDVTDGTHVQAFIYTFSKEKPLERLTIYLSDELKGHLELDGNEIEINIAK